MGARGGPPRRPSPPGAIGYCGFQTMLWAAERARAPGSRLRRQEGPWNGPRERDTVPYASPARAAAPRGAVARIPE